MHPMPSLVIAALSSGGILYRLATESVQQRGLFDTSHEQYVTHQTFFVNIDQHPDMLHYSLTPSEIDIIVGAYTGYDRKSNTSPPAIVPIDIFFQSNTSKSASTLGGLLLLSGTRRVYRWVIG